MADFTALAAEVVAEQEMGPASSVATQEMGLKGSSQRPMYLTPADLS